MKKTNKHKLEQFIRVDHAGERGAIKIYEGQLLALNTIVKNKNLKKKIEEMKIHEKEHCDFFENEIKKRNIKTTKFLPIWDLLGVTLGFGSTLLGKKAAMLCTASVEEVIDEHYQNQINQLMSDENILKEKIKKFREDELHHKDIAYKNGATKKGVYFLLDKILVIKLLIISSGASRPLSIMIFILLPNLVLLLISFLSKSPVEIL